MANKRNQQTSSVEQNTQQNQPQGGKGTKGGQPNKSAGAPKNSCPEQNSCQ